MVRQLKYRAHLHATWTPSGRQHRVPNLILVPYPPIFHRSCSHLIQSIVTYSLNMFAITFRYADMFSLHWIRILQLLLENYILYLCQCMYHSTLLLGISLACEVYSKVRYEPLYTSFQCYSKHQCVTNFSPHYRTQLCLSVAQLQYALYYSRSRRIPAYSFPLGAYEFDQSEGYNASKGKERSNETSLASK
ncbi:hypothetical protein BDQ17DRAFT_637703 [Cyathus striatus]|nr:hypothetical protein BDQ17DRAFT_637703 [Cyathus striatus]